MENKPELKLSEGDGNAISILARARRVAINNEWDKEKIDKFMAEAKSGNYDHLLQTCMEYFDVT
jgi:hypothetical protein